MEQENKEKCPLCGQEINDEAKAEKAKKENLKNLYKRYNECRDFQLDRFWKNSIFIWTFLAVCFTCFGSLFASYLNIKSPFLDNYYAVLNTIICTIALILSIYWLKLTKASKAWYEVFENAIWTIESHDNFFSFEDKYLIHNFWNLKTQQNFKDKKIFEKMFSTRAYSLSKIIIAIAWLLVFFWLCALIFGGLVYYFEDEKVLIIFLALVILLFVVFYFISESKMESSSLRDYSDQKLFEKIRNDMANDVLPKLYFEIKNGEITFFFMDKTQKDNNIVRLNNYFNQNTNEELTIKYNI